MYKKGDKVKLTSKRPTNWVQDKSMDHLLGSIQVIKKIYEYSESGQIEFENPLTNMWYFQLSDIEKKLKSEYFNKKTGELEEVPDRILHFLNEVREISEKYGVSISHEDCHGAFIIEDFDPGNLLWLESATININ